MTAPQQWLPISDETPRDGTWVLIAVPHMIRALVACYVAAEFGWVDESNGSRFVTNPTHWMPLPILPTGDA